MHYMRVRACIMCAHALTADLKVIYVHDLLKIVGNSVSNVQIGFIFRDLLWSLLFGITCFWLIPVFELSLKASLMRIHYPK